VKREVNEAVPSMTDADKTSMIPIFVNEKKSATLENSVFDQTHVTRQAPKLFPTPLPSLGQKGLHESIMSKSSPEARFRDYLETLKERPSNPSVFVKPRPPSV